ncbi:fumarate reductase/succinate dehydrogenase flavoprotein subunit [Bradyrhizobium sp. U87765 SZCCT0131]|uniref:fumarate reductase/succinate dehydrogenase flavoprotein subunit n=1 Tax=unclassified Bradyrhizobium TaxID=2631580 RepID=UPI001BABE94A|nr:MULTISPECIES: fumarate reductase/succinate dehydrogenase flavoprotein subunit [unclassified Bradyrhizobium]MBR1218981.1 fumarate reductase/succinate dehydrogenase flavoprotein subunit [Bradyrhizobium sp. U87765 SZCCT0131]MBR1261632.1 fumarate reductase/succinate dehydrogenase flavoprotein subunit [Bradyrhizobium sp. U87765 SZCCT0134]MBR1306515.1 fumarate reductase/succinate dehydrogenase flavoprotein subunit [Bradyrhizobium sp. U87765 SZCCT0110]MBR1317414.1 fumarate reductase/succinate dehyd
MDEIQDGISEVECDVLVIGGGTAGPMAAYKARRRNPAARVVLLEKANVKRSGAIAMGMDGLNNAVVPGYATPEQYTKEITIANDGIVDQAAVYKYASRCFDMIQELDSFGIKFQKTENGDFDVKKVHHLGSYVLPMPNGDTIKKALYRQLRRERVLISNRFMATRLLTAADGRIAGAIAVNTRTAEILVLRAKAVILCAGAAGRLGLPHSGYLWGTYENATNSGDGYAMAYHAGAALANLECFQINPLIKDYNGPACAYVAGPFGAYTANSEGRRFIECDYWSGQMMQEFYNELQSGKGPVFLKLNHLHSDTIGQIEAVLHKVERPSRGRFHDNRGTDYRAQMIEMHISEIGLCSGHSASGVFVDEFARTTVPGLYAAGDMASVPHNYMLGAFTNGAVAGEHAADHAADIDLPAYDHDDVVREQARVLAPTRRDDGIPPNQLEYKVRRLVNDYLQPPKVTARMQLGQARFAEARDDLDTAVVARDAHELMRALEVSSILDCADMAAFASLYRTESRWGLYHHRVDHPDKNDAEWFCHSLVRKVDGRMTASKRAVAPYIVPIDEAERGAYDRQRIRQTA